LLGDSFHTVVQVLRTLKIKNFCFFLIEKQKFFVCNIGLTVIQTKMINRPTRIPAIAEKAGSLLWYMRMDWGRISPNTT